MEPPSRMQLACKTKLYSASWIGLLLRRNSVERGTAPQNIDPLSAAGLALNEHDTRDQPRKRNSYVRPTDRGQARLGICDRRAMRTAQSDRSFERDESSDRSRQSPDGRCIGLSRRIFGETGRVPKPLPPSSGRQAAPHPAAKKESSRLEYLIGFAVVCEWPVVLGMGTTFVQ
jgi:hypothetical protein